MTDENNQQDSAPSSSETVVETHSQEAGGAAAGEPVFSADAGQILSGTSTSSIPNAESRLDGENLADLGSSSSTTQSKESSSEVTSLSSSTDASLTGSDVAPAVAEPGEGVAPAADASSTADSASATPASTGDISSPSGASSLVDDTRSFEQRVEDRFLQLEGFLMRLPRSIHHAMSQGSADVEEFAGRVVAHLFSKE